MSLDGENVVVLEEGREIGRVPLHNLQSIVTFGYTGASPALMGACAQKNIDLTFMSGHGRFLARVTGEVKGNVTLRNSSIMSVKTKKNPSVSLEILYLEKCIMHGGFWKERQGIIHCGLMLKN